MKVYFTQVERVLNSLPIGYYAGRRIPVSLSSDASTSFIDMISQAIVVSYPQVEDAMAQIENEAIVEQTLRNLLYHEVSHALLTHKDLLYKGISKTMKSVINIMEDERIETALGNYYHNVDFKNNVKIINHWDEMKDTPIRDAMDAFYRVVRFHVGKKEWVERAEKIVEDHIFDNARYSSCWLFRSEAWDLYKTIEEELGDFTKEGKESSATEIEGMEDGEDCEESESEVTMDTEERGKRNAKMQSLIEKLMDSINDNEMAPEILTIIQSFNKKTSGGSAIAAHSGVLNPRLVGRPDYRIFERKSSEKGANKFNAIHINLFLDESGSYISNVPKTNKLIQALANVEKIDKNFTFDIVYCGMGERIVTKKIDRMMKAGGGNSLDDKIFSIFRKVQKPNAYNYNIVLFDGDAFTDSPRYSNFEKNFGAFNHSNCTIISDYDNMTAINRYAPSARRIFTRDYVNELQKNVVSTLRLAFR